MFCPKCGEILRDTALKCSCCRASLRRSHTEVNQKCDHRHGGPDTVEAGPGGWRSPAKWDQPQRQGNSWLLAFTDSLRHYADMKGRTSRPDFLKAMAVYLGILIAAALIDLLPLLWLLLSLAPMVTLCARRLHDTGLDHKVLLLWLIPWIGAFVILFLLLRPSAPGNKWGIAN